mgnify:CR=1 FL=1
MDNKYDHYLDITSDVCPMTFVKTRLLIEKMNPGETAEIRLTGGEPLENVPDSVVELGHKILGIEPAEEHRDSNIHCLRLQKA